MPIIPEGYSNDPREVIDAAVTNPLIKQQYLEMLSTLLEPQVTKGYLNARALKETLLEYTQNNTIYPEALALLFSIAVYSFPASGNIRQLNYGDFICSNEYYNLKSTDAEMTLAELEELTLPVVVNREKKRRHSITREAAMKTIKLDNFSLTVFKNVITESGLLTIVKATKYFKDLDNLAQTTLTEAQQDIAGQYYRFIYDNTRNPNDYCRNILSGAQMRLHRHARRFFHTAYIVSLIDAVPEFVATYKDKLEVDMDITSLVSIVEYYLQIDVRDTLQAIDSRLPWRGAYHSCQESIYSRNSYQTDMPFMFKELLLQTQEVEQTLKTSPWFQGILAITKSEIKDKQSKINALHNTKKVIDILDSRVKN